MNMALIESGVLENDHTIPRIGTREFTCTRCGVHVTIEFRPGMADAYIDFARRMLHGRICSGCAKVPGGVQ